ncbi:MAG: 2-oxoglutarate dehydrogenase complex dihydrolipoyllysine-residue succinyltransferase [Bacteriovoracaceae bacterium]|jgi:2-oxoglutarate dehydrogenase E2 component (dihydrolipoamide succinyltransferase)|nr:2-oxoglutarate dehydrogenase complex dihydrolipoyllysine-residue succinyltransferase [Bacteriovoracaceae bacterium]
MAIEIKVPQAGESVTEATLAAWLKEDGDYIEEGDLICELETDKANMELPADGEGVLKIMAEEGEDVKVGAIIATLVPGEKPVSKPAQADTQTTAPATSAAPAASTKNINHPSPAAAKILNEKGVNPSSVSGTGKDGRITKADALSASAPATKKEAPAPAAPVFVNGSREVDRQKMSRLRKTIARKLTAAKNETAMLTTFNEVDMKPLMDMRKKYQDNFVKTHDIKLGFMSLFTKACTIAMRKHPLVNAQIDGEEMVVPSYVDMGIAVSSDKGLVVPVVRNAESMSLAQIEKEIKRLATKARDGKITIDDMSGGTFTITNGGVFGSMLSTPIINAPQSAILGMHNIVQRPWVVDGKVEVRPIMYIALSYDHRIIDGKDSVGFLKTVKELLEDPQRMILDL